MISMAVGRKEKDLWIGSSHGHFDRDSSGLCASVFFHDGFFSYYQTVQNAKTMKSSFRLAKLLEEVAISKEIIVALANSNVKDMLEVWFTSIKKVGNSQLDDPILDFCKSSDLPVYKRDPDRSIDSIGRIGVYGCKDVFDEPAISIELLDRVARHLSQEPDSWDQAVFNEKLFFALHPEYDRLHAAERTMDFLMFMNSKVLFKTVRKDAELKKTELVIVHRSYHPDEVLRMKAVIELCVNGKQDALEHHLTHISGLIYIMLLLYSQDL